MQQHNTWVKCVFLKQTKMDYEEYNKQQEEEQTKPDPRPSLITIEDYQKLLEAHDWDYEYTDDHQVWKKGSDNLAYLCHLYNYNDLYYKTNNYWKAFNKQRKLHLRIK